MGYLTPAEQRLVSLLPHQRVVTVHEISKLLKQSPNYISEILSRLRSKGFIIRVKKGTYYIGKQSDANFFYRFALSLAGKKGPYLAFSTALKFHNLLDEMSRTIYVATYDMNRIVRFGRMEIKLVPLYDKCTGYMVVDDLLISTLAKTLFDCLLHPEYCGGLKKIAGILKSPKPLISMGNSAFL